MTMYLWGYSEIFVVTREGWVMGVRCGKHLRFLKVLRIFLALVVSSLIKAAYVDKRVWAFPGYSHVHRDRFEWAFVDAVAFHSLDFAVH